MNWFFEFFRWIALFTGFPTWLVFFKCKTYYEDKKRQSKRIRGGALVISNHFNVLDYLLTMFIVLPRKLNVVASEMPYKSKLLSIGMRFFGGIEANRETRSMRFVDQSAEVIRRGQIVQIYPEGRNTDDGELQPFKPSYIVIAHRANAPIIPIVTDGNYHIFKRAHIIIGVPIYLSDYITTDRRTPSREELAYVNEVIHAKVAELRVQLEECKARDRTKKSGRKRKDDAL